MTKQQRVKRSIKDLILDLEESAKSISRIEEKLSLARKKRFRIKASLDTEVNKIIKLLKMRH